MFGTLSCSYFMCTSAINSWQQDMPDSLFLNAFHSSLQHSSINADMRTEMYKSTHTKVHVYIALSTGIQCRSYIIYMHDGIAQYILHNNRLILWIHKIIDLMSILHLKWINSSNCLLLNYANYIHLIIFYLWLSTIMWATLIICCNCI